MTSYPSSGYRLVATHQDQDGSVQVLSQAPPLELRRILQLSQLVAIADRFAAGLVPADDDPPSRRKP